MCGRFTITVDLEDLRVYLEEHYQIQDLKQSFDLPRFNVSPGQDVITIINDGAKNRVGTLRWGLVPSFAKDEKIGYQMINAKAETLHSKPSFLPSFTSKRCVILADSFYEWKRMDGEKQPMRIQKKDEKIFPMAGLWSTFVKPDGSKLHTCTIITTEGNALMKDIHDRMPVILDDDAMKTWLNPRITNLYELSQLLKPYDSNRMKAYAVSTFVNASKNESPDCIKPLR
jgi:putative SOS response-associated peptidase YedK